MQGRLSGAVLVVRFRSPKCALQLLPLQSAFLNQAAQSYFLQARLQTAPLCELVPSKIPRTHSVTDIMCQVRWVELCDIWMTMNMVLILKLLLPSVKRFKSVSREAMSIQKKNCKDVSATHWPLNRDSIRFTKE